MESYIITNTRLAVPGIKIMMRFKVDKDTIWYETGIVMVHNFPPAAGTKSFITRIYREHKKGVIGFKKVEGEPIDFQDLDHNQLALATIIGNAQNALNGSLPHEKHLKPIQK